RTGLQAAGLHCGERRVDLALDVGGDRRGHVVERGDADTVVRRVVRVVAAGRGPRVDGRDDGRHRDLEVLLGTRHEALVRGRVAQVLVHVDADAIDPGRAGRVEDAVAGEAGDLEQDVDLGVGGQVRLGEPLAARLILERSGREVTGDVGGIDRDARVDRLGAELVSLDVANARG